MPYATGHFLAGTRSYSPGEKVGAIHPQQEADLRKHGFLTDDPPCSTVAPDCADLADELDEVETADAPPIVEHATAGPRRKRRR